MRIKRVNRYYCEFCKKANCSAGSISRHESACTMNPNRVCRVCKMVDQEQESLACMIAILPPIGEYRVVETVDEREYVSYYDTLTAVANKRLPKLRDAANNCPACILAAIRQAHIPVRMVSDFNFADEMKAVWQEFNNAQAAECQHG